VVSGTLIMSSVAESMATGCVQAYTRPDFVVHL